VTRDQLIETMARGMAGANYDLDGEEQLSWVAYTHEARGALTAIEAAGMRVVPVEPTEAMLAAVTPATTEFIGHPSPPPGSIERWRTAKRKNSGEVYRAMVLAAQEDSTSE